MCLVDWSGLMFHEELRPTWRECFSLVVFSSCWLKLPAGGEIFERFLTPTSAPRGRNEQRLQVQPLLLQNENFRWFLQIRCSFYAGPSGRVDRGFESHRGHGCLCVVRYRSLRRVDHSSRGVLPTVVRRCLCSRNLKNEEAMTRVGSQRHSKIK